MSMRHDASALLVRTLAVFIILIVATQVTTWWVVHALSRDFDARATRHLSGDVARVRERIKAIERDLDSSADRLKARITSQSADRAALFRILRDEVHARPGRGARVLTPTADPIAWWGEDLPFTTFRRYQFDVTNLYIVSQRQAGELRIETFARIPNEGAVMRRFHGSDAWIVWMKFHGGFLPPEASKRRYLIDRQMESALWLDVLRRSRA